MLLLASKTEYLQQIFLQFLRKAGASLTSLHPKILDLAENTCHGPALQGPVLWNIRDS